MRKNIRLSEYFSPLLNDKEGEEKQQIDASFGRTFSVIIIESLAGQGSQGGLFKKARIERSSKLHYVDVGNLVKSLEGSGVLTPKTKKDIFQAKILPRLIWRSPMN